ncbi:hypothetical protein AAG906_036997 [Vitis piasezkii]
MAKSENENDFKQIFIIFPCATVLALMTQLEGHHALWHALIESISSHVFYASCSHFPPMTIPSLLPHYAHWIDVLVRKHVKLEVQMLGASGHVQVLQLLNYYPNFQIK